MSRGVLYIATKSEYFKRGDYLKMALRSIDSLQKVSKLPITLITNVPCDRSDINVNQVESVYTEKDYTKYKLFYFLHTPYESTLYIDADTEVLENPEPLFSTEYDLCMPHEPRCDYGNQIWRGCLNSYSTGTFLYNKNLITDLLFERAKEVYIELEKHPDARIHKDISMKDWEPTDRVHLPLSDQYSFNRTVSREISRLGITIKPLHPRWLGIAAVERFLDNVAIVHSRCPDVHRVKVLAKWTIDNPGLLEDLARWS